MSVAGIAPYVGDALNMSAKVGKFLGRNATLVDDVVAAVAKIEDIPAGVRADVLRRVNTVFDQLSKTGISDDALLRLARSRHGVEQVTSAMRRAGAMPGARLGFPNGWVAAEDAVAGTMVWRGRHAYRHVDGTSGGRVVDIVDGRGTFHEVKSGFVTLRSRYTRQIEKDARLMRDERVDVTWHFVASNRSGSLGADPRILDLLDEVGIRYVIHLP